MRACRTRIAAGSLEKGAPELAEADIRSVIGDTDSLSVSHYHASMVLAGGWDRCGFRRTVCDYAYVYVHVHVLVFGVCGRERACGV